MRFAKEKFVHTFSTQSEVRFSFIQPFRVAATTTPGIDASSFLTFAAGITTYGFIFVPSAFTARHTVSQFFFSCPVVLMGTVWTPLLSTVVALGTSAHIGVSSMLAIMAGNRRGGVVVRASAS